MFQEKVDEKHMTHVNPVQRSPWRTLALFVRDVLVIFAIAIVVSFVVKTFLVRSFFIPSASMEQTLVIDDRVIVNELVPAMVPIQRGDIVVFRDPGGWLPATVPAPVNPITAATEWTLSLFGLASPDSNDHLIKRVIGLPGDKVACCDANGKMTINGVPINEPYIMLPSGETKSSGIDFSVTVPEGSLWVMGDNRYNSKDSRYNTNQPGAGFVPVSDVVGRAFVISWPMSRWSWLGNYPDTFAGVPAAGQ